MEGFQASYNEKLCPGFISSDFFICSFLFFEARANHAHAVLALTCLLSQKRINKRKASVLTYRTATSDLALKAGNTKLRRRSARVKRRLRQVERLRGLRDCQGQGKAKDRGDTPRHKGGT